MAGTVRRMVAEFLGTYVLVLIGGLSIVAVRAVFDGLLGAAGLVAIGLGFGLALLAGLYAFGEVSGHFNPAVSLGALLDRRIGPAMFGGYVVVQVAGALVAGLALWWASSRTDVAATATVPGTGVGAGSAFLLELLLTAVFVGVILKVTTSVTLRPSAFLAIPLTLGGIVLTALPFTGGSVNPARTLGPAIVGGVYDDVWVYLTAPFAGALLGWALYRFLATGPAEPGPAEPGPAERGPAERGPADPGA